VIGRAATVLAYSSLVVAGFVVGVAGSFLQAVTIQIGPISVPIGLVGMLAATGLVFFAGAWLDHRPIGVLLPALAWLLGVFPFTIKRPEGDLVLSGDLYSYGYLLLGAALAVLAAMYPGRRVPGARAQEQPGESAGTAPSTRESPGGPGHKTVGT
jgi:Family of unknown function (DUF6113)